jgi:glutathione S-transferase
MLQLVIGNKNYSSWSMRPWVLMTATGHPFDETQAALRLHPARPSARRWRVSAPPAWCRCCWTTASRCGTRWRLPNTCTNAFPRPASGRPTSRAARPRPQPVRRDACRLWRAAQPLPDEHRSRLPEVGARIWAEQAGSARRRGAAGSALGRRAGGTAAGPSCFGDFCAADAFFAPVCMRLSRYALPVSAPPRGRTWRGCAHPAWQPGSRGARPSRTSSTFEEPYRTRR